MSKEIRKFTEVPEIMGELEARNIKVLDAPEVTVIDEDDVITVELAGDIVMEMEAPTIVKVVNTSMVLKYDHGKIQVKATWEKLIADDEVMAGEMNTEFSLDSYIE